MFLIARIGIRQAQGSIIKCAHHASAEISQPGPMEVLDHGLACCLLHNAMYACKSRKGHHIEPKGLRQHFAWMDIRVYLLHAGCLAVTPPSIWRTSLGTCVNLISLHTRIGGSSFSLRCKGLPDALWTPMSAYHTSCSVCPAQIFRLRPLWPGICPC